MYTTHILNNGIRVILSKLDAYRSTSIGLWIKTGSIDETEKNNGISHFIEHMLFKGSSKRSARDIAEAFDSIGGDLNAFTSKECTCFHAKVLDRHVDVAIEIIADMISDPLMDEEDIKLEKSVVLDEIMMADDTPDDVSYDLISQVIYHEGTLSRPILGTKETLESIDQETIQKHLNDYYTTDNLVISIAGSFDEVAIIELLNQHFTMPETHHKNHKVKNYFHSDTAYIYRDIEQVHLEIGYEGISYSSDEIFNLAALNNILGASVSSRLFQNIRESRGLTYSINSYLTQYEDNGLFSIYASMQVSNLKLVCKLIKIELDKLLKNGIEEKEFLRVKEQLKGNYILDLEGTDSYMNLIGKGHLFNIKIRTPDEVETSINNIKKSEIEALMFKILSSKPSIALVGRVDQKLLDVCTSIIGG
ncbi:MAG: insulinase family protein [Clostridiales bacterium]|nr:insulinase family protein [Clostridiales bacterium]